jgi:L-seryl-tRNA(Ser) seleniumtransferase
VKRIASDPLMRALRVDKMTLSALEATLRILRDTRGASQRIPLWRFLSEPIESLLGRAARIADRLRGSGSLRASGVASEAFLGGGSVPMESIPSAAVRIEPPWPPGIASEAGLSARLRRGRPPVVPRVRDGAVWLDLRAIPPEHDDELAGAILRAVASPEG